MHACQEQAEAEAAAHALGRPGRIYLERVLEEAACELGDAGVRGHGGRIKPQAWAPHTDDLPASVRETGCITRGDVLTVAAQPETPESNWQLWLAVFVWGFGTVGYAPARLGKITALTPPRGLAEWVHLARQALPAPEGGPIAAYDVLRGTGTASSARGWGPAFFTKLLYFADARRQQSQRPRALVLDNLLAHQVTALSGLPHLLYRGRAARWSPYRYGICISWMVASTATSLDLPADEVECALFLAQRRGDPFTSSPPSA